MRLNFQQHARGFFDGFLDPLEECHRLAPIDDAIHVEDADTVRFVYRLLREEGLFLGSTSGINVAAAVRVALELGRGHTIVTILCDGGAKYQSRLFNREWLEQKGLAPHAGNPTPRPPITLEKALVA